MAQDWREASEYLTGKVKLEITGGQGEITTNVVADCYYRNGSFYLLFEERPLEDGKAGELVFSSRLKISDGRVALKRSVLGEGVRHAGHVMEMLYEKRPEGGRGSLVLYPTPYGMIQLEIQTSDIEVRLQEKELVAEIAYLLLQEGQEVSRDHLRIRIGKLKTVS